MAQFINEKETVVAEAIDGLVAASGGRLARLDGYPHTRVVIRQDWDRSKVALISGGGAGHEPAHAGFVGKGMLAAAVCGDVFASPTVDAVLAGILAVTGPEGCLLIVKNYTGDRLNFGLAAERARSLGVKVAMVIIDDDIALPELAQPRGVAGTLFIHKLAGALAESGADLETVATQARGAVAKIKTIGLSLDTCTVPGSPKEARIAEGQAELGLGIHGEPGTEQITFEGATAAVARMAARLADAINARPHVALVNNLGGTSVLEMSVLMHALSRSAIAERIAHVIGPAAMMTSLDMPGFSISLFQAEEAELRLLQDPTPVPAWPGVAALGPVTKVPLPSGLAPVPFAASEDAELRARLEGCCAMLMACEEALNALDAKSGDGDTGSTLAGAAKAMLGAADRLPFANHADLCRAIAQELSQTMGGSSGVLLAIFFAATGDAAASGQSINDALRAGLARVQEVGGARLGDRTMIDALSPALDAWPDGREATAAAARAGADHTATLLKAEAGRAAYVGAAQLEGHADPGAEAVARVFEFLAT
ncbi:MAG: dihydroxyacetone kinase subunit DhaK [Hyphomicrobiaceae bacterium]